MRFSAVLALVLLINPWTVASAWATGGPVTSEEVGNAFTTGQRCYGQQDYPCVIKALAGVSLPADHAQEGLRLLAFAYARLDRHAEARSTFDQWIKAFPDQHLDKASTPPQVFDDYAAAQLQVHQGELDLTPHLSLQPAAPQLPTNASDLPKFAPPKRSSRDTAQDFTLSILALGGYDFHAEEIHVVTGAALGVDVGASRVQGGLRLGIRSVESASFDAYLHSWAIDALARASVRLVGQDSVHLDGWIGGGAWYEAAAGLVWQVAPGLRLTMATPVPSVQFCTELHDAVDVSSGHQTLLLSLGICLRPNAPRSGGQ